MNNKKAISITMGDPSGISGELILKTWIDRKSNFLEPFFVLDVCERLKKISSLFKLKVPIKQINYPQETFKYFDNFLPVINISNSIKFKLGFPDKKNSKLILNSINKALDFAMSNQVKSVVTSPVSKNILIKSGFKFYGQTEYISNYISKKKKKKFNEVMILSTTNPVDKGPNLIVGLITTHIPVKEISKNLKVSIIVSKIESFIASLKSLWKVKNPKIGICGFNPHAGEFGLVGDEERKIILPSLNKLKKKGISISGLLSADTCFSLAHRKNYDGIVCMYHDQGLIPVKTLDFFRSVNITGGLPLIRTSPDHGPAFDIAHKNKANNSSYIAAIKLASEFTKNGF